DILRAQVDDPTILGPANRGESAPVLVVVRIESMEHVAQRTEVRAVGGCADAHTLPVLRAARGTSLGVLVNGFEGFDSCLDSGFGSLVDHGSSRGQLGVTSP